MIGPLHPFRVTPDAGVAFVRTPVIRVFSLTPERVELPLPGEEQGAVELEDAMRRYYEQALPALGPREAVRITLLTFLGELDAAQDEALETISAR